MLELDKSDLPGILEGEKKKVNIKKYITGKVYSYRWLLDMVRDGRSLPREDYIVTDIAPPPNPDQISETLNSGSSSRYS